MFNDHVLTRRSTLKLAGAGAVAAAVSRATGSFAFAQESTPAAGGGELLAAIGLPELNITISDTDFQGIDAELAGGMYLVHATVSGSQPSFVDFMQLPDGVTFDDVLALLSGEGGDSATPGAEGEGGGDIAPPDWYYTTYIAGGAGVAPGQTAHFVVDLRPGTYMVWGDDPTSPQAPVQLTVTGDAASPSADLGMAPQADVTISEVGADSGFAFQVDGSLSGEAQVVAITNESDQPHFLEFDKLPDGATKEDVDAVIQSFMTGTPAAGGITENDFEPTYFVGTQSGGSTQWHEVALPAGTYFIACFVPDSNGGLPHAFEGMYDVITVGG